MEQITSPSNPLIKNARVAVRAGRITNDGWMVAEGPHLVLEAFRSGLPVAAILLSGLDVHMTNYKLGEHGLDVPELEKLQAQGKIGRILQVPKILFDSITSTAATQGIIAMVEPPPRITAKVFGSGADAVPLVVVLDGVQDPGNAGAIVRAAEAFGATGVIFLSGSVNPYNPKCIRGSAGSLFRLPILMAIQPHELLEELDHRSMTIFAADAHASLTPEQAGFAQPSAVIIGSEGRGVREELLARSTGVSIPTRTVESLNAAVAAGVLLYEARKQRLAAGLPKA